jgi:hypothetical protein
MLVMADGAVWKLTQVLDVLIGSQGHNTALLSCPHAGTVCLVDDDAVRDAGRQEGGAVGKGSPSRGEVKSNVRQAVAQSREQQRNMSSEPGKLQSLRKSSKALAQRHRGWRWGCHCCISAAVAAVVWAT